jgi:hypothetical protein
MSKYMDSLDDDWEQWSEEDGEEGNNDQQIEVKEYPASAQSEGDKGVSQCNSVKNTDTYDNTGGNNSNYQGKQSNTVKNK